METIIVFIFIAAFVALLIFGAIHGNKTAKLRREAFLALSTRLGLAFAPGTSTAIPNELSLFATFNRGHSRCVMNTFTGFIVCRGEKSALRMGDYQYKTTDNSGKNRSTTTHNHSYLILTLPYRFAQDLSFRKEGFFDRIAGTLGFEDINFESAEFSRKFHVRCKDKKLAYDLFDPRMMQWLLEIEPPSLTISTGIMAIIEGRWSPEQFEKKVEWVREFVDRWPEHLVQSLGKVEHKQ